jgi:hypothetical protein
MTDEDHETRELRFRLKQANKVMGSQGQRIYELSGQLAELREITGKIARGEVRETERELRNALADNERLRKENQKLRDDARETASAPTNSEG